MHLVKTFSVLRKLNVLKVISKKNAVQISSVRWASTSEGSPIQEAGPVESEVGADEKKTLKGPFIKNLFAGVFDTNFLEYPEYPSLAYIKEVDRLTAPVEEYFSTINSAEIDKKKEIPQDILATLKEHGLYALQAPKHLGGLEFDDKCFAKFFESIGKDISVSTSLASHYRSLHALLVFGSEEQREQLIPRMLSGEIKIGFGLVEKADTLDLMDVETTALPIKNDWKLNGKKIWIQDGDKSDYFLVFAKTWSGHNVHSDNTVFIVDRNTPGVKCGPNIEQLGTRAVGLSDVVFEDVVIPKENILGPIGGGVHIAMQSLCRGRLISSAASVGYLKGLLDTLTEFIINTKIDGKSLNTYEYYKKHLGAIAVDIYALESMVYLTAGLKDMYEDADFTIEESIVRLFSMEKTVEIVDLCASLCGGSSYIVGSPLERSIRDARSYLLHDVVPNNVTKLFVATACIQHAGIHLKEEIKKARNPFNFPAFALKNMFKTRDGWNNDNVPGELRLRIHPSLGGDANRLEKCVIMTEMIIKDLLQRYGIEILDRHMDLIRLTDCVTSMYAMTAIVARASRSYCIGLSNSNFDFTVSNIFCGKHAKKVEALIDDMNEGPMASYETPCVCLGEEVAMHKGYFLEHPLARSY